MERRFGSDWRNRNRSIEWTEKIPNSSFRSAEGSKDQSNTLVSNMSPIRPGVAFDLLLLL